MVGEGAAEKAHQIRASLDRTPIISARVHACVLVGERRWDLNLDNGVVVHLPESDIDQALTKLADFEQREKILERNILAIDMRLSDRMVVRLTPDAAAVRAEQLPKFSKKGAPV